MKDNELSIVLPIFNEASIIENVIREINAYTIYLGLNVEIIAVNDGSTDNTLTILNQMSHILPNLKVVSHSENRGYGSALCSGIKASNKAWVLLMDADGQFRIDSLEGIWLHRNEYDIWLGYRQKRRDSIYRVILGKLGNAISNILLGRSIRDVDCGFKLFNRNLIYPLSLSSNGNSISFEILYRLFRYTPSLTLHQYPVEHYPRQVGKSTGGNLEAIFKIVVEGIKILLEKNSSCVKLKNRISAL